MVFARQCNRAPSAVWIRSCAYHSMSARSDHCQENAPWLIGRIGPSRCASRNQFCYAEFFFEDGTEPVSVQEKAGIEICFLDSQDINLELGQLMTQASEFQLVKVRADAVDVVGPYG
eukprot:scaffold1569_cov102-Cylindrotheca_fusiformis.AAC.1